MGQSMRRAATFGVLLGAFGAVGSQASATQPVAPGNCEVVSATHSADAKGEALKMSQALATESAKDVQRAKGWRSFTMSAFKVTPAPFWKTVRPVVPEKVIYGSFVTAKTYSVCFTGVVVPFVCTSGARVCGK
jgi:hypothetical protein